MQSLLNYDLVARCKVIQSRGHRAIPPFDGRPSLQVARGALDGMGIVYHHDIGALAGCRSPYAGRDAITCPIVFVPLLLILVAGESEAIAPTLLIPIGLY